MEHRITITFPRVYVYSLSIRRDILFILCVCIGNNVNNYYYINVQVQEQSPSSQTMDSSNDASVKVVNNSFSQPGAGNAIPGYPPQQPPQSQQSLHNSNG